jgi:hypothetical protein
MKNNSTVRLLCLPLLFQASVLHMKPEGGKLIHQSELGTVAIEKHAGALRVSSGGIDPTAKGLGMCGAHADIDGLAFSSVGNRTRSGNAMASAPD